MAFFKSKNNLSDHVIKLKKELDSLDVKPESLIPPYILRHFEDRAKRYGVNPIAFIPIMLASTATVMGKAKVKLLDTWKVPTSFYGLLDANKGAGKTSVHKVWRQTLLDIEKIRMEKVLNQGDTSSTSSLKKNQNQPGRSTDPDFEAPKEPSPKKPKISIKEARASTQLICETGSKEGLFQVLSQNGGVAIIISDEYSTIIESIQKGAADCSASEYMSRLIQMWDNEDVRNNTKGDGLVYVQEPYLQIAGSTQSHTLLKILLKLSDTQGFFDRHILIFAPDDYSTFREKASAQIEGKIKPEDLIRTIYDYHDDKRLEYRLSDEALEITIESHDDLQIERKAIKYEPNGDDIVGEKTKMFSSEARIAAMYQALENAIKILERNENKYVSLNEKKTPQRNGASAEMEIEDELYLSQQETGSNDGSLDDSSISDDDSETNEWNLVVSKENLEYAKAVTEYSENVFQVFQLIIADVLVENAPKSSSPSVKPVPHSAIPLDDESTVQDEFIVENFLGVANLFESRHVLKDDSYSTTVRQELKKKRVHPVGPGQTSSEEYEKFIELLAKRNLIKMTIEVKSAFTIKKIKILESTERNEDGTELLNKLKAKFIQKNAGTESPFDRFL